MTDSMTPIGAHVEAPACRARPGRRCRAAAGRRMLAVALASLLFGPPAPAAAAPADADPHDLFQSLSLLMAAESVFVTLRPVSGSDLPRVYAELRDADDQLKGRGSTLAGGDGSVELRLSRAGLDAPAAALLPGDRLRLRADYADGRSGERELTLPLLGVDLGPEGRSLSGWAPPGESVMIITADARGNFASDTTAAAVSGRWQVQLDADLDLGPGASGTVLLTDRAGNVLQASWTALKLHVTGGSPWLDLHLRPGEEALVEALDPRGRARTRGKVRGGGGPLKVHLRDGEGTLAGPRPGDRLRLTFSGPDPQVLPPRPAIDLPWPALGITVDEAAETAWGEAPPGTRLWLTPEGRPQLRREVEADASGAWRADWSGAADLGPEQALQIAWPDFPNLGLLARATALDAADPAWAQLRGRGVAGEDVAARLVDAQGRTIAERRLTVAGDGRFAITLRRADLLTGSEAASGLATDALHLDDGQALQLVRGATDEVGGAVIGRATRLDLQPAADADTELLSLARIAGYRARARVVGQAAWLEADPAEAERWVFDLSPQGGLAPGLQVELSLTDAQGIDRGLVFPVFRLSAYQDGGWLLVEGPPGLVVPIEQERDGKTLARGGCSVEASRRCIAWLKTEAGAAPPLLPGDTVLAFPEAAASASLDLVKLTAHIDLSGRDVTGQAPPGRPVDIVFSGLTPAAWPSNTRSATDPMGVYDYELNSSQWDLLRPGLVADVFLEASSGHRNAARGLLERLQLSWDGRGSSRPGGIEADVEVGSDFTVEAFAATDLDAAGRPLPGRSPLAGYQGRDGGSGANSLPDTAVRDLLTQGALLRLDHRRGRQELPVIDLAAWIMDEAGRVAGFTAPFQAVHIVYRLAGDAEDASRHLATAASDAAGHFLVEPAPVSLRDLAELRVSVSSGQGEVRRSLTPRRGASAPYRAHLPAVTAGP